MGRLYDDAHKKCRHGRVAISCWQCEAELAEARGDAPPPRLGRPARPAPRAAQGPRPVDGRLRRDGRR